MIGKKIAYITIFPVLIFSVFILFYFYVLHQRNIRKEKISEGIFPSPTQKILSESDYVVITETPIPTPTLKPSLTPSPTIPPKATWSQLEAWFAKYASEQSVSVDMLKRIASCESGYNPNAVNGPYGGMFQFSSSTWISTRTFMNRDPNPVLRFDAEQSIMTAAVRLATMGKAAWPNCGK